MQPTLYNYPYLCSLQTFPESFIKDNEVLRCFVNYIQFYSRNQSLWCGREWRTRRDSGNWVISDENWDWSQPNFSFVPQSKVVHVVVDDVINKRLARSNMWWGSTVLTPLLTRLSLKVCGALPDGSGTSEDKVVEQYERLSRNSSPANKLDKLIYLYIWTVLWEG